MVNICLPEDHFGYGTEIFLPNVISCGAVVVKLTNGFIGFHFTVATSQVQIEAAMNYAVRSFFSFGGTVVASAFFVDESYFGKDNIKIVKSAFKSAFKLDLKVVPKPNQVDDPLSTDLWVHKPTDPGASGSWLGVRIHDNAKPDTQSILNPQVLKIKTNGDIDKATIQLLPADVKTGAYKGKYMHVEV